MEVRSLENKKDENKLSFILKDSSAAFANTLRRIIVDEVPTMAIEDVEFRENGSVLYDEIVAHRLGLIPLETDLKSYSLPEKCKCEGKGCARCQVKLVIKEIKSKKDPLVVYSSELKSKDPAIKPVFPKIPIVTLHNGQSIELEATAVLGKGKTHSKWTPALVYYKSKPIIEVSQKCSGCGKCVEQCPLDILELKNNKAVVNKDNLFNCHLCEACKNACPEDRISITKDNDFIFYIESWGQLNCKEIVKKASELFDEMFDELAQEIKKIN